MEYVQVAEEEGDETIELPIEDDGTLLLSTLQAQFVGTSGLKYRNPVTNATRGIRLSEGRLHPPIDEDGWGAQIYLCVFPKGFNFFLILHHTANFTIPFVFCFIFLLFIHTIENYSLQFFMFWLI